MQHSWYTSKTTGSLAFVESSLCLYVIFVLVCTGKNSVIFLPFTFGDICFHVYMLYNMCLICV